MVQNHCVLHRFYKQNEIACILWFGVLGGLAGALRQACFVSRSKTSAGIKILPGNITFCSLAPVAWQLYFWGERGLEVAKTRFSRIAKTLGKQTEINQNDQFMTS